MSAAWQPFVSIAPDGAIVLDLGQPTIIDGGMVPWLVEVRNSTGHPVVLRNASPAVRRTLDIIAAVDSDGVAWVYDDPARLTAA